MSNNLRLKETLQSYEEEFDEFELRKFLEIKAIDRNIEEKLGGACLRNFNEIIKQVKYFQGVLSEELKALEKNVLREGFAFQQLQLMFERDNQSNLKEEELFKSLSSEKIDFLLKCNESYIKLNEMYYLFA